MGVSNAVILDAPTRYDLITIDKLDFSDPIL
jgi:hypothetical protein